jgi:hypothetical protein
VTAYILAPLLALAAEAALGGAVVCAEARGLCPDEQAAVGAVVRELVRQRPERSAVRWMRHPRAFARSCPPTLVRPEHVWAYVRGRLGWGPEWARGVLAFHARRMDATVGPRWERRGWTPAHRATGHTYYTGRLDGRREGEP